MNDPATSTLRDIHLPEPVSWWPPGPGWWVLLALAILLTLAARFFWQRYQKLAARRAAESEMARIKAEYKERPDLHRLAADLSTLLRRTSLSYYPRQQIAALSGDQWLKWLDQKTQTTEFSLGPGKAFATAPYQANPSFDADALIALSNRCLLKLSAGQKTT